jgi:hypothetical protein
MAQIIIAEPLSSEIAGLARRKGKSPTAVAEKALREFLEPARRRNSWTIGINDAAGKAQLAFNRLEARAIAASCHDVGSQRSARSHHAVLRGKA